MICLFVADGKGGHQRVIAVAGRFLQVLGDYLQDERPATATTDRLFVAAPLGARASGPAIGRPRCADQVILSCRCPVIVNRRQHDESMAGRSLS